MINIKLFISLLTAVFLSVFFLSPNISQAQKPMFGFSNHPWVTLASEMPGLGEVSKTNDGRVFFYNVDTDKYSFYGFVPKNIKVQNLGFEFFVPKSFLTRTNYEQDREHLYFYSVFFDVERKDISTIKDYLNKFYGEYELIKKKYDNNHPSHYMSYKWQSYDNVITLNVYKEKGTMTIGAKDFWSQSKRSY